MSKGMEYLDSIKSRLREVDIVDIQRAICELPDKVIPSAMVHKGHVIDRVSIHDETFRAPNIQRLSYIKDIELLKRKKINQEYGRANLPGESIFYGALLTDEIKENRVTAFMETTSMTTNRNIQNEFFTVSRWRIVNDFEVLELVFHEDEQIVNFRSKMSLKKQYEFLEQLTDGNKELKLNALKQLKFFTSEFSKSVDRNESYNYKISAAFSNCILNHKDAKGKIFGLSYPSVQSKNLGQNIALSIEAVEHFLKFEKAVVMKAERTENGIFIGKSIAIAESDATGLLHWIDHKD